MHMNADPRVALEKLTLAFERHLEACSARRGESDPAVVNAYFALADAFEAYDDALVAAYNEVTPLEIYADDDLDEDDDEFDDEYDEFDDGDDDGDDLDDDLDEDDLADDEDFDTTNDDNSGSHRTSPSRRPHR